MFIYDMHVHHKKIQKEPTYTSRNQSSRTVNLFRTRTAYRFTLRYFPSPSCTVCTFVAGLYADTATSTQSLRLCEKIRIRSPTNSDASDASRCSRSDVSHICATCCLCDILVKLTDDESKGLNSGSSSFFFFCLGDWRVSTLVSPALRFFEPVTSLASSNASSFLRRTFSNFLSSFSKLSPF